MKTPNAQHRSATTAVLTIAEIKAAIAAFDRGEANAFDTLDAVRTVVADRPIVVRVPGAAARRRRRAA